MQNQENYKYYSVQNFICDEFFQDCVLHPDLQKDAFWENWVLANPEKQAEVEEAILILKNLRFRNDRPGAGKAEASLKRAWQSIQVAEEDQELKAHGVRRSIRRIWKVAAICIVFIGIGWMLVRFIQNRPSPVQAITAFGELDSVYLPDRTLVVMNANSSIRYDKNWTENKPREVWLNGEALFHVRHLDTNNIIQPEEQFLVHVGETTIEVLGTVFDIRQRRGKIEVALLEGAVRVHFDNQSDRPDIQMKPGELVMIDTAQLQVKKTRTNTVNYADWTKKKLRLNNPTLQEIAAYLEDIYGKRIILSDPDLATRKVEGPILLDSLDDALFIISTVLNVKIIQNGDTLIIKSL